MSDVEIAKSNGWSMMDFGHWVKTFGPAPKYYGFNIHQHSIGKYMLIPDENDDISGPFETLDDAISAAEEVWNILAKKTEKAYELLG